MTDYNNKEIGTISPEESESRKGIFGFLFSILKIQQRKELLQSENSDRRIQVDLLNEDFTKKDVEVDGWIDSKDLYERARESYTNIVGIDIAFTTPNGELILPKRKIEPLVGEPWFVGGRFFAGETVGKMIERTTERDTNLIIDAGRSKLIAVHNYYLANSDYEKAKQEGLPVSHHAIGLTYTIQLTHDEVSRFKLSEHEYGKAIPDIRPIVDVAEDIDIPQPVRDIAKNLLDKTNKAEVFFRQYKSDDYEQPPEQDFSDDEERQICSAMSLTEIRVVSSNGSQLSQRLKPGDSPDEIAKSLFSKINTNAHDELIPSISLCRETNYGEDGNGRKRVYRDSFVFTYHVQ